MPLIGFLLFIPMMGLMSLSFFILFTITKTEKEKLRSFGRVLAVAIWVVVAILFVSAILMITNPGTATQMQDMLRK